MKTPLRLVFCVAWRKYRRAAMRPETGRVDMLLVGSAAAIQVVGLLALYYFGILDLSGFWRWWLAFL
jgi:hypothetical protein